MSKGEIEYGEIKGILAAFANLNNKRGYSYEFNFIREEKGFSLKKLVDLYCSSEEAIYELSELNDWKVKISESLEYFLFQYFTDKHGYNCLRDSESIFSFSWDESRKQYINLVIERIERVSCPIKVWQVDFDCFIDGLWQGFIIEGSFFEFFLLLKLRRNINDFLQPKPR